MPYSASDLIRHILDEVAFLIGEAAKKVPDDFKVKHPEVSWKSMARMRDKLIHHYFGVDYSLVWNTVQENIPKLEQQLKKLI